MTRLHYIDLAKGITIICVVFFHAAATTDPSIYYYDYLQIPILLTYSFIMPLFFMISAALLRTRLESDNFSNVAFLKKITSTILIPFYTLNFLFFLMNLFFRNSSELPSVQETIQGLLYMQTKADLLPSGVLWFLFVLFSFALVTFVFIKILKVNIYTLFIFSVILKLLNMYFHGEYDYFAISKISQYYVYYTVGYLLSNRILKANFSSNNISTVYFFICWIIAFYFAFIMKTHYIHNILGAFGAAGIFGSLFILSLSNKINNRFAPNGLTDFLCFCGVNSILIYVFHTPTFLIIRKVMHYLNFPDSIWGFLLTFLCATFFPLIYGKILSYNSSTYKLLLGRNP